MDEAKTFQRLKQISWDEVNEKLKNLLNPAPAPLIMLNDVCFESKKHELVRHYERIKCLKTWGWTLEEFVLESEKRNILSAIDSYNVRCSFPLELVNRAKEFFPNAKFTQAKIELE